MDFEQVGLQFSAAIQKGEAQALSAIVKQFRETKPKTDKDVRQCVNILAQCTKLQPCELCDNVINLVRDVLLQVKSITDETYFEVILLRNELQLKKKGSTTKDFDQRRISLAQFGRLLVQLARFQQDTDPVAAVQKLRLALALKEDVLELLIPLSIFTGNLSNLGLMKVYGCTNVFVDALLGREYASYEQLLAENAASLVEQQTYSFYARGLLMIKKLCLDAGEVERLPAKKRDLSELQKQTKQIQCGSQMVRLDNVMEPRELKLEQAVMDLVRGEDQEKLRIIVEKLNKK